MLTEYQRFLYTKYPYLIGSIHLLAIANLVERLELCIGPMMFHY